MTSEFEKYYPLPWYAEESALSTMISAANCNRITIFTNDHNKQKRESIRYAIDCANLMPEAAEALNSCKAHFEEYCDHCEDTAREECPWCSKGQTLEQVKSVLAKLEGGDVHVPDTSGS